MKAETWAENCREKEKVNWTTMRIEECRMRRKRKREEEVKEIKKDEVERSREE